jgi:hypothetical protein
MGIETTGVVEKTRRSACSLQGCVEAGAETEPRSGACERGKERADCTACDGGEKCGCG